MPRKSTAALTTPKVVSRLADHRPPPPDDLDPEPAAEWRRVVRTMPADWFKSEAFGVLAALCCHSVTARRLSNLVETFELAWTSEDGGLARYDHLLRLRQRETKSVAMLATRLRLTPQSRYTTGSAATAAARDNGGPRPWDPVQ